MAFTESWIIELEIAKKKADNRKSAHCLRSFILLQTIKHLRPPLHQYLGVTLRDKDYVKSRVGKMNRNSILHYCKISAHEIY